MPFPVHPHMLRHGCGYALAKAAHDTRALQAWLGHRNIQKIDETEASDVPARMRQARNEALLDGIVDSRHNDGNEAGRVPQRPDRWRHLADDYVRRERHQFCYVSPYAAGVGPSKSGLDLDVAAVADDYVRRERHQFCCVSPYAAGVGPSKSGLDLDVAAVADDYVRRERHQFCCVSPYAAGVGPSKSGLDLDVAA